MRGYCRGGAHKRTPEHTVGAGKLGGGALQVVTTEDEGRVDGHDGERWRTLLEEFGGGLISEDL